MYLQNVCTFDVSAMSLYSLNTVQNKAHQMNTSPMINKIEISVVDRTTCQSIMFLGVLINYPCIKKNLQKSLKVMSVFAASKD